MRVYVTLAGTEKKLRLRVPESWEDFMSVLRGRFNISDDARLELKDAGTMPTAI